MSDFVEVQQNGSGGGYRSTGGLTIAIVILIGVHVLATLGEAVGTRMILSASGEDFDLAMPALVVFWSWWLQAGTFIAATVCFLVWLHRGYANLPALGSESLVTMTPKNAVTGWFIPFYNLVHGYKSVHQLYLESQRPAIMPSGFVLPTSAHIVGWWWGLYLARNISIKIAGRATDALW